MGHYEILALISLLFLVVFIFIKRKVIGRELKLWNGSLKYQFRLWSSREFIVLFASFAALALDKLEALDFMVMILLFLVFIERMSKKKIQKPDPEKVALKTWSELFREIHQRWSTLEFAAFFAAFTSLLLGYLEHGYYMMAVGGFLGVTGITKIRTEVKAEAEKYEDKG